jgi:hypothetical protein
MKSVNARSNEPTPANRGRIQFRNGLTHATACPGHPHFPRPHGLAACRLQVPTPGAGKLR